LIATEKSFRRIMGHEQLWMLKSQLDNPAESKGVARQRKTGYLGTMSRRQTSNWQWDILR